MTEGLGLAGLFLSSFLAATLLPGGSEAVLFGVLRWRPDWYWHALAIATLGNTLGGMTSYLLGRVMPGDRSGSALAWLGRYGSPALLLAWAPLVGDALCVAAGWLRIDPWRTVLFMAVGKFARYLVVAQLSV